MTKMKTRQGFISANGQIVMKVQYLLAETIVSSSTEVEFNILTKVITLFADTYKIT